MLPLNMKRLVLIFISLLLLCSCSDTNALDINIDINELMQNIIDTQTFSDEMMVISSDSEYSYLIDEIIGSEYSQALFCFPSEGISSDMILIVEAKSESDSSNYTNILATYLDERYDAYMGYAPEEAKKIKDGTVETHGKYVLLMVLSDVDSAQSVVNYVF